MASYSAINASTACLDNPWSTTATQQAGQQGNRCWRLPSSFNPYNRTRLPDIKISSLEEIIANPYFGHDQRLCSDAVELLPPFFHEIDAAKRDPRTWNPPVLAIRTLTAKAFPSPLNESGPGLVAGWWWEGIVNDTDATVSFINTVEAQCTREICMNLSAVGDPDIAGIGMLISTGMLIVLALIFSLPASFGLKTLLRRQRGTHPDTLPRSEDGGTDSAHHLQKHHPPNRTVKLHHRLRPALLETLDDLLSAIIIFMLSVLIAAIVLRRKNEALFDIFMAEALSLISGFALVMVASAQWASYYTPPADVTKTVEKAVKKQEVATKPIKLWTLVGVAVNAVLLIILFCIEFEYQHAAWVLRGIPLERRCLQTYLEGLDLDNLGRKRVVFPLCFCLWLAALAASLTHLPWVRKCLNRHDTAQDSGSRSRSVGLAWWLLGQVPMVFGTVGIILLCAMYFYTYRQMKSAFGQAFVDNTKDWGFGQYLALATWVPPFLQLLHVLFRKG